MKKEINFVQLDKELRELQEELKMLKTKIKITEQLKQYASAGKDLEHLITESAIIPKDVTMPIDNALRLEIKLMTKTEVMYTSSGTPFTVDIPVQTAKDLTRLYRGLKTYVAEKSSNKEPKKLEAGEPKAKHKASIEYDWESYVSDPWYEIRYGVLSSLNICESVTYFTLRESPTSLFEGIATDVDTDAKLEVSQWEAHLNKQVFLVKITGNAHNAEYVLLPNPAKDWKEKAKVKARSNKTTKGWKEKAKAKIKESRTKK